VGKKVAESDSVTVIESVKIAADVYTPINGTILRVNEEVRKTPTLVNDQAEKTWLVEISCDKEPSNLLNA
jgi:glycine cleavage system H protein